MDIILKFSEYFSQNVEAIETNLVSSVIWFSFGVMFTLIVNSVIKGIRYTRYRKIFGKSGFLLVLAGDRTYVKKDDTVVRAADFRATTEMSAFLERNFPISKRTVKDTAGMGDLSQIHNSDVVLIGGPNNNPCSHHMFEALRSQGKLSAEFQGYSVHSLKTGSIWSTNFDNKEQVDDDYAIAYGFQNPFNQKYRVLILAGCKGVGTIGVVKWVVSGQLAEKFPLLRKSDKEFCYLVKCHAESGELIGAHLLNEL